MINLAIEVEKRLQNHCAIRLLPGTSPPKGRLYSLSGPKRDSMEDYIPRCRGEVPRCRDYPSDEEEGQVSVAVHQLSEFEQHHDEEPVPSPAGFVCVRAAPLCNSLHETGLKRRHLAINAPAVFQGLVRDMLRDMLHSFVFVYINDILIFFKSLEDHVQHVRAVLLRLIEHSFVKLEKCEFQSSSFPFLGYLISPDMHCLCGTKPAST